MSVRPTPGEYAVGGAALIAAERQRQIDAEGWTPEHDDEHEEFEMARAAIVYAKAAAIVGATGTIDAATWRKLAQEFPWQPNWFKPSGDPIRNLVKAGALIAAEIDRLERAR